MTHIADNPSTWGDPLKQGDANEIALDGDIPASEGNPGVPLNQEKIRGLSAAASLIDENLAWRYSREGHEFWQYVNRRLREMARSAHS